MKRDARRQTAFRNFLCNSLTLTAALGTASALALSAAAFAGSDQMGAASQTSGQAKANAGARPAGGAGPTAQDFTNPIDEASYWILPAGDYSGNRQIKEKEIGPSNVDQMQVAWTFNIPQNGPIEASPIVWNGTIYITSNRDDVYAIDAKTGNLKWRYNPNPEQLTGFPRNRGVAIYDGKLFIGMINGHLAALDAETGKELWNKQTVEDPRDSFYSMQPVPYKGKILLGVSNGDWGGNGNISAFDPDTGNRIWQFNTIPGPGEKGHETWEGDSWKRGGGAIWSGAAIDPNSDTLYVNAGNPLPDFLGAERKGDNLYTNSMIAVDISGDKPQMKWYHQFIPHGTHDWDPAMPPVLFTGKVDSKDTKLVAAGDKAGNFWILNAENGDLVSRTPVSYQFNQDTQPAIEGSNYACPNTNGGVEFNGGAYDPATNIFFVPSTNQCGKWSAESKAVYVAGQFYLGGSFPSLVGANTGWFNAIDVATGAPAWRDHLDLPANGGALVMDYESGGKSDPAESIVFSGMLDGKFNAYDARSGKILWQYDTGASIIAPPATFTMDNRRYVLVNSGDPGWLKVPELQSAIGPAHLTAFVSGQQNATQ
jgi:alcohol dehydrogenase (cytochrome c)